MRLIKAGATDQSVMLRFLDSTDGSPETGVTHATAGLTVTYRITGGAAVALTSASSPAITTLSALTDAHTDAAIKHVGDGWYRFDLPDAAVASGVQTVVTCTATGMVGFGCVVQLVAVDPQDAVKFGMTRVVANVDQIEGVDATDALTAAAEAALVSTDATLATLAAGVTVAAGGITAASIATGAIDADALAADAVAEIADTVLRRTMANIEASAYGDTLSVESLYGLLAVSFEAALASTTLTIRKSDGSTLGTKTLSLDGDADPIVGIT